MGLHPKPRDLNKVVTDDPIELSSKVIDECATVEPTNRVTNKLSELGDDIAIVESFSHMVALELKRGLSYLMQAASRAEWQLLIHCESGIQIGFILWFIHMGT